MGATGGPSGVESTWKIMANIFISFIGAGVLGLPFAFKEAGLVEGAFIMAIVGVFSVKAMLLIIDIKYKLISKHDPNKTSPSHVVKIKEGAPEEKEGLIEMMEVKNGGVVVKQPEEPSKPKAPGEDLTYGDVGYFAMGYIGRLIVELSIVVSQMGFCCAYLIFISENLSDYITGLKMCGYSNASATYHWLLILLPFLGALSLLRSLGSLAMTSFFAQCSNLLAFAVVFWFDFDHFHKIYEIHPKKFSLAGLPFFLAIAIYCYEGAGMILSLESSLHPKVKHRFKGLFKTTLVFVTLLYISFGSAGYLSFGVETNAIITLNLPVGEGIDFATVVKSCLCLALFFTYPVMMFPVIKILERKFISNPQENMWKGNILRLGMVTVTGFTVLLVPNFANLMALVGASCCMLLAFILPGLFHIRIYGSSITKCGFLLDVFLIVLGLVGTIIGLWDALVRLYAHHEGIAISTEPLMTANETLSAALKNVTLVSSLH